ncbi:hypothetical protein EJ02DRAFT_432847 [Clathrospora elynae]|uniref:Translation initiation factor 5A-like N-terminal domain-containing protein n=1 Tax=Clathrospora elynae TaxID=706981 RepID=A0A6A5STP6_9PLEO|nr:hypothetical protein EJ02DRAFT_432847 [Clathrospora elynae]
MSSHMDSMEWVPIPFSVFPSAYRNAEVKESTTAQVEQEQKVSQESAHGREGHEEIHESFSATVHAPAHRDTQVKEEVRIYEEERLRRPQPAQHSEEVHIHEQTRYRNPQPPQHREEVHIHEQNRYKQPQHPQPTQRTDRAEFEVARDRYQPQPSSSHTHLEAHDSTYDRHFNTVHGPATDYAPSQIDVTERQFRERTRPIVAEAGFSKETFTTKHDTFPSSRQVRNVDTRYPAEVRVDTTTRATANTPKKHMGYYDNEGQYHSIRHGISDAAHKVAHKVAERVAHPIHPNRHHHSSHQASFPGAHYEDSREEVVVKEKFTSAAPSATSSHSGSPVEKVVRVHSSSVAPVHSSAAHVHSSAAHVHSPSAHVHSSAAHVRSSAAPVNSAPAPVRSSYFVASAPARAPVRKMASTNTITIPCHHIRIGDLLILQGRPCQVIRITTSSQTGQHRYLGVDLFTKQLHEESSFISNPAPSVVVQNMLGPVFKQYRVLDIREDGRVVAMTESGDVKQGLPVLDQSGLITRLTESFDNGRGSVRILVINDDGLEMAVDYKVVHGSRL